ncbi:MAG: hypothetical protein HYY44_06230, partial [Deltaproteobacteria bacterium]|nr:hypothetical protein [Deltaproteobacteria bacterium]
MKQFSRLILLLVVVAGFSLFLEGEARATCSDFEMDDHLSCQDHCTVWNSGSSAGLGGTFPNRMFYQRMGLCRCWL